MLFKTVDLPESWKFLQVVGLSDVHRASSEFNHEVFNDFISWVKKERNTLIALNGDLIDAATKSSKSDAYSATMTPHDEARWVVEALYPIRKKIIGATCGNHEARISRESGFDAARYIAEMLEVDYNPVAIYYKFRFGKNKRTGRPMVYTMYVTHGAGGGVSVGGKTNQLLKRGQAVVADVIMIGHVHQTVAFTDRILVPDLYNEKLSYKQRYYVSAGSFLDWEDSYGEAQGYLPGNQTMPVVRFDGRENDIKLILN